MRRVAPILCLCLVTLAAFAAPEVKDAAPADPAREALKSFDWLVGAWRAEYDGGGAGGAKAVSRYTVERRLNGQLLVEELVTKQGDEVVFEFLRVTRWDPESRSLKASIFPSRDDRPGVWTKDGGRLLLKESGRGDGGDGRSATLVFEPVDKDTFKFNITERKSSGQAAGDSQPLTFRRVKGGR